MTLQTAFCVICCDKCGATFKTTDIRVSNTTSSRYRLHRKVCKGSLNLSEIDKQKLIQKRADNVNEFYKPITNATGKKIIIVKKKM